jgi:hypothetical protein
MVQLLPEWIDVVAEEAHTIALSMLQEKGRGAVLVGAARVDTALESLLKAALAPPSSRETLFHTDRPLGSFGARIALAQRLGLIDPAVEQSLHALRKVRNAFAHSTAIAVLSDPSHQQRLDESYRQARANPLWQPLAQVLEQHQPRPDQALRDYILLVTILVAFLEATAKQLRPYQPQVVMGLSGITVG